MTRTVSNESPSNEALVLRALTGHRAKTETSNWYCRTAADGPFVAYGGYCVLSAAHHPYEHTPTYGIVRTPYLYLMLAVLVYGVLAIRRMNSASDAVVAISHPSRKES